MTDGTTGTTARILAMATLWEPEHGGITAFNRQLCRALAETGAQVFCAVRRMTEESWDDAQALGVTLLALPRVSGAGDDPALGYVPVLPGGVVPDIVVGHGRGTGPLALALKRSAYRAARLVQVVHMAPSDQESLPSGTDESAQAEELARFEVELASQADQVLAVGPHLTGWLRKELPPEAASRLVRLDPGFDDTDAPDIPAALPSWRRPGSHKVLLLGRLKDWQVKGVDIAARALTHALDHLPHQTEVDLTLHDAQGDGQSLRVKVMEWAARSERLSVTVEHGPVEGAWLRRERKNADLVLMPSRAEEFGLAGLEAATAGVPLLVSDRSGVGMLLREVLPVRDADQVVIPVTDRQEEDAATWGRRIAAVLADREAAFDHAALMRRVCAAERTWATAAQAVLTAIPAAAPADAPSEGDAAPGGRDPVAAVTGAPAGEGCLAEAVGRYAEQVRRTWGHLDLEDLVHPSERDDRSPVWLREVFVAPAVRAEPAPADLPEELARRLEETGDLPPAPADSSREAWARRRQYFAHRDAPALDALRVLAHPKARRAVLLGDPGTGKSTLARYLTLTLLEDDAADGPLAALAGQVPVVVDLHAYARVRADRACEEFEEFLGRLHEDRSMAPPWAVMRDLLESGRATVVFDGLDALSDPRAREDAAHRIAGFADRWPRAHLVVTSRPVGHRPDALRDAGFAHHQLQHFDELRVETFARRWYASSCPTDPAEGERLAEQLIAAVRTLSPVRELTGIPLLLTHLAATGRHQALPHDRRAVHERAVTVMVAQWERATRSLQASLPGSVREVLAALGAREHTEILQQLARAMQEGGAGISGNHIHVRELEDVVRGHLQGRHGVDRQVARLAAQALIGRLRTGTFLLAHQGGGVFGFVCRGFLDHLAATALVGAYTDRQEWTPEQFMDEVVVRRAVDPDWHEVLPQVIGRLQDTEVATAVDRVLALAATGPLPRRQAATLALRALAEAGATDTLTPQGIAAVDAATGDLFPSTSDDGVRKLWAMVRPALASFGPSWPGRSRYLRWYHLIGQFTDAFSEPARVACALLGDDPDQVRRLAVAAHHPDDRVVFLDHLAQTWPDRPEVLATVQAATTDPEPGIRRSAMAALKAYWPDHPEALATVWAVLQATVTDPDMDEAFRPLLEKHWPDPDEVLATIQADVEVLGPSADIEDSFLGLLAAYWPDRPETLTVVQAATAHPDLYIRCIALEELARHWPDRAETLASIQTAATHTDQHVRGTALRLLVQRWRDRPETLAVIQATTTHPSEEARSTALHLLGSGWPDRPDTLAAAVRATIDPEVSICLAGLSALRACWPEGPEVLAAVQAVATTLPTPDLNRFDVWLWGSARREALGLLGRHWPDHPQTFATVRTATTTADPDVRCTALSLLAEHWSDRPEALAAVQTAATDSEDPVRRTALSLLAEHWPDRPEALAAVQAVPTDPGPDLRHTALQSGERHLPRDPQVYGPTAESAVHDPSPDVRTLGLGLGTLHLADWHDGSRLHTHARTETDPDAQRRILRMIALEWPADPRTANLLWDLITTPDVDDDVRDCAQDLTAVLDDRL
ncbi:HEAT repeat domain-containing protein [Streptomyces sp. NBC_00659]|uniref:HEAT repeat domain-containing protein n=1 Tax=Streptomyces sp. NBC_00659 TaxID=2903669 RepID=UPI002E3275D8|nr:HEAT repeat domain-containing protein [Streptomyces sp. NBC_00659]